TLGEKDYDRGFRQGKENDTALMFHLTITIDGVNRFVTDPDHDTSDVKGYVKCDRFGGERPVESGTFNLFVEEADAGRKRMLYRLFFSDDQGRPLTLSGFKEIADDPGFDVWADTTTLFTRIYKGRVGEREEAALQEDPPTLQDVLVGSGIVVIHFFDFLKQLTT